MANWVGPPASYTRGRVRPVQYVVIHTTEGTEGYTSAEAGVAYDKRRTDGVSTHIFVDADTALMEVRYGDRAHHARWHGNEIGIGVELCGTARQTAAQWRDPISASMLALAAVEVAAMCRAYDLPVRRLSVAEVRAAYYAPAGQRPSGICGHVDVTAAYPEDGGSHYDPGPHFPWDGFLAMVRAELEDDMTPAQALQLENVYKAIFTGGPSCGDVVSPSNGRPPSNSLVNKLDAGLEKPAVVAAPIDPKALEAAVRTVMLEPATLAAYAKAVNDDSAKRQAA